METTYSTSLQGAPCMTVYTHPCNGQTLAQVELKDSGDFELWLFDPWQYRASGGRTALRKTLKGAQSALDKHLQNMMGRTVPIELTTQSA